MLSEPEVKPLQTFWYLAAASYLIGSLPVDSGLAAWLGRREIVWGRIMSRAPFSLVELAGVAVGVTKGLAPALLARSWVGSHMAVVLATIFMAIGHMWPLAGKYRPRPVAFALLGAFVAAEPRGLLFFVSMGIAAYAASRSLHASTMVAGISIPFYMYYAGRPDNSVLLGILAAGFITYQALGYMEKLWGVEGEDGCSRSEKRARTLDRWRRTTRRGTFLLLVICVACLFFFNRYVYRGFGLGVHLFRQGTPDFDLVVLTFDDGPDPTYTPAILDILNEHNIKAAFFMVGAKVDQYPEIARRVVEEGHEVGNHTYSHRNLFRLPREDKIAEIELAEEAIIRATGVRPTLFRPPRGLYDAELLDLLEDRRYTMVMYSLSSRDWAEIRFQDMAHHVLASTRPGDIILFHDSGDLIRHDGGTRINTVRGLPLIISGLKDRGYAFVSVLEMMIITGLTAGP